MQILLEKTQDSDISIGAGIEYKEWKMKTRFWCKKSRNQRAKIYYLAAYLMENDLEGGSTRFCK